MMGLKHDSLKYENTAKAVMKYHGIESWNARALIGERLKRQTELAKQSPLSKIKVGEGLAFMQKRFNQGYLDKGLSLLGAQSILSMRITREQFVAVCWDMMKKVKDYKQCSIEPKAEHKKALYDIFDSIDFDKSGTLSRGEWAGACSVFFRGTTEEYVTAVFSILDTNGDKKLPLSELQEYLRPYVDAMTPVEAEALRPMLLKRATETIFKKMDVNSNDSVSLKEMLQWTRAGNNIIDSLAAVIDGEVYAFWLKNSKDTWKQRAAGANASPSSSISGGAPCTGSPTSTCAGSPVPTCASSPRPVDTPRPLGSPRPVGSPSPVGSPAPVSGRSPVLRGSLDHFHSTASHWSSVPPPPPPPQGGCSSHLRTFGGRYGGGRYGGC